MKRLFQLAMVFTLAWGSAAAQEAEQFKTQWGHPDLQGVWNFSSDIPLQRPQRYGNREFLTPEEIQQIREEAAAAAAQGQINEPDPDAATRGAPDNDERFLFGYDMFWYEMAAIGDEVRTSQITYPPDGRMPAAVEGVEIQRGGLGDDIPGERPVRYGVGGISKDGPEDRGLSERCIVGFNAGPPLSPSRYNNNIQIFQNRDHVVILSEMIHNARIVPLDGRAHLDGDHHRFWTGDSRGWWDGETLVVETRNFNDLTTSFGSLGNSYEKVMTERFTRVDYDTLDYVWTLEDPATFTDRITATLPLTKVAGQLYEYACNEGNYGMENVLRGARAEERRARESGGQSD